MKKLDKTSSVSLADQARNIITASKKEEEEQKYNSFITKVFPIWKEEIISSIEEAANRKINSITFSKASDKKQCDYIKDVFESYGFKCTYELIEEKYAEYYCLTIKW